MEEKSRKSLKRAIKVIKARLSCALEVVNTTSQFKIGSDEEEIALGDLYKKIKNKKVTRCQELQEELDKFSNLDREE
jgi:hypothetical protein